MTPLASRAPDAQFFHLAGPGPATEKVAQAYAAMKLKAVVHPSSADMHLALGAATWRSVAPARLRWLSSRPCACQPCSFLIRQPAIIISFTMHVLLKPPAPPGYWSRRAATPELLVQLLSDLVEKPAVHEKMQSALAQWHAPRAAEQIAEAMLALGSRGGEGCHSRFGYSAAAPGSLTVGVGGQLEGSRGQRKPAACGPGTKSVQGRRCRYGRALDRPLPSWRSCAKLWGAGGQ